MFINSISSTNFNAVVPLKKGQVTLKLTASDKKQIEELIHRRTELDLGLRSMESLLNKRMSIEKRAYYEDKIIIQTNRIKEIDNAIREIKISRYNKQKARAAAKEAKKLDINA